jgi:hypothetical protein
MLYLLTISKSEIKLLSAGHTVLIDSLLYQGFCDIEIIMISRYYLLIQCACPNKKEIEYNETRKCFEENIREPKAANGLRG